MAMEVPCGAIEPLRAVYPAEFSTGLKAIGVNVGELMIGDRARRLVFNGV